jgi:hypothetical protein
MPLPAEGDSQRTAKTLHRISKLGKIAHELVFMLVRGQRRGVKVLLHIEILDDSFQVRPRPLNICDVSLMNLAVSHANLFHIPGREFEDAVVFPNVDELLTDVAAYHDAVIGETMAGGLDQVSDACRYVLCESVGAMVPFSCRVIKEFGLSDSGSGYLPHSSSEANPAIVSTCHLSVCILCLSSPRLTHAYYKDIAFGD